MEEKGARDWTEILAEPSTPESNSPNSPIHAPFDPSPAFQLNSSTENELCKQNPTSASNNSPSALHTPMVPSPAIAPTPVIASSPEMAPSQASGSPITVPGVENRANDHKGPNEQSTSSAKPSTKKPDITLYVPPYRRAKGHNSSTREEMKVPSFRESVSVGADTPSGSRVDPDGLHANRELPNWRNAHLRYDLFSHLSCILL